jgi:hypothetical protein
MGKSSAHVSIGPQVSLPKLLDTLWWNLIWGIHSESCKVPIILICTSQLQPLLYMKFKLSFISCMGICDICNVIGFGRVDLYLWWMNLKGTGTWKVVRSACLFLFKQWFPGMRCCVLGTKVSEEEHWRQRHVVVPNIGTHLADYMVSHWTGWSTDGALNLCPEGAEFDSWPGHQILTKVFYDFTSSVQANAWIVSWLDHNR